MAARPSQIAHLTDLLVRLGRTRAQLESTLGKSLPELTRTEASQELIKLQNELRENQGSERHRAYLPEAVDQFEMRYLAAAQDAQDTLHFTLFDGSTVSGQVIGFGPYSITVRQADETELTLNKLALVSYCKKTTVHLEPSA